MDYQDKTLTCKDCGKEFIFTAGEQEFYAEKGFQNEPSRCHECRDAKRQHSRDGRSSSRKMYEAVCAKCGVTTQVPFEPKPDRPVYCRDCFNIIHNKTM
ncbi:zinc-ribbon domain containing protein [Pectinatus frisingensis]|uniref:zinc-ribbon domain containing protein n=1 Tax=Pectinatus frisingensis TaxID=865 RepID=UPI0018C572D1|nr:zinc-ribbon domain containing protein [Pectinatus frisingensis]